jgi:AcrR family transcriptional regulator
VRGRESPTSPQKRMRAPRSDATRNTERLLTAARELFEQRGAKVAMDEIARRAGVGNATLYRRFPSRSDILVAVYSDEVAALCREGQELLDAPAPADALFTWLDAFVAHVTDKRELAFAATQGNDDRRNELFRGWHASMINTAARLLNRAQRAATIRQDLTANETLVLANSVVLASSDRHQARRMMGLIRQGVEAVSFQHDDAPRSQSS